VNEPIEISRGGVDQRDQVVALASRVLGWDEGPNQEFFSWKHDENPFGASPLWVARAGGALVGFRTLLRWQWITPAGEVLHAVRAVDTVTDPAFARRGIFRRLTLTALAELTDEGVAFVFNTPNEKSRPGYLEMGWSVVGRPPIAIYLRSVGSLVKAARSRRPADKWSIDTDFGIPAPEVLADEAGVGALLASQPPTDRLTTRWSVDYLQWRYGFAALHYRVCLAAESIEDGFAIVRLRRRGAAVEGVVADLFVPGAERARRRALLARLGRMLPADYGLVARSDASGSRRWVPAVGQGPVLCWRAAADHRPLGLDGWRLSLGDLELF